MGRAIGQGRESKQFERDVSQRLKDHKDLMDSYIESGIPKVEASEKAYRELFINQPRVK
jgi:hypothetical protein